jgi:N-acetylneuraminic acid mutarotase
MPVQTKLPLLVLALGVLLGEAQGAESTRKDAAVQYPPLPKAVTSFGAAIVGDALYVYGGHTGRAHSYYQEAQEHTLRRLDLSDPQGWEALAEGPRLQSVALLAHDGKLYRIGGFTAKNSEGEARDFWSQDDVARYDPATDQWQAMPPLPEPRSSFDAAVLGDKIYVVGGWRLRGDEERHWHKTAWGLDLSADSPTWKALPEAPFQRRAVSVAAHDGKIFVIGGMQKEGGTSNRVDIYDPAGGKWSRGPSLPEEGMKGFGSSAFAVGGRLHVSTISGNLLRLARDGQSWEIASRIEPARFFHRMLPLSEHQLLLIGGANMEVGKFADIEIIEVE